MKKRLLPVALFLGTIAANAQVGIGTATPNKSAELLIESSNRGLLIPNVSLKDTKDKSTITNGNVQSLLVYATKTQGDITPGYYYWDVNVWKRLTADADIPQIVVNNFQEIVNKDGDKVQNIIKNIVKNTEGNVIYEGDKFYTFTKDGDKIVKQEIKDKLTTIIYDDASGDYIYYNENAVDRNGKIIGEGIRIKVKETVIKKFGDIINNKTVQEHITNYLDGTHVGGNVYYEGDKLTYITKQGDRKEVSINSVVTANESKTAIITVNKKQYYVAEEYLVANKGVVPTTVDATNLPKGIYAIDVVGGVVNNLEEIVNSGPVNVDGRTFKTVNDYITYLTESKGGFTKIVYNQSTGDVIFQEWNETTQKYVNVDNSKFSTIVKANETVTTLVKNNDGTYTYTNEKGTTTIVDIPGEFITHFDTIVKQPVTVDGRIFTNVDEYIKYVTETKGGFTKIVYNKQGDVVFQEWNETTQKYENVDNSKFSTIVKGNETVTTLVDKGDGTLEYTDEKGKTVSFDSNTTTVSIDKGIYTFKDGKGGVITTIDTNASATGFDDTKSQLGSDNVQGAIDNLVEKIGKGAGVTLVDNNNGTITLKSKDGDVLGTVNKANLTNNNDGTYTFDNGNGTPVVIDTNADAIAFDNSTNGFTSTNVQGALEELKTQLSGTSDSLVNNNDGTYTHTTVSGDVVIIDANTTTVSIDKGIYTFKDGKGGVITTIDTNASATGFDDSKSQLGSDNVQGAIDNLVEKIGKGAGVTLVDNNNGTITLKSKDGDVLGTVNKANLTNNNDGTYTFDNGNGTPVVIDTNADAIAFDNSTNGFTSTNVQGALEELKTQLAGTSDTLVNNNDGTYTHTTVSGDVVIIDANTTTVSIDKGIYTFKDGKGGVITTIDTNASATGFDDSKSQLGSDNVQGAIDNLVEKIGKGAGVTLVDNNNGTITLKSKDGDVLGTVNKANLTNNNDGTYTFDNGNGTPVVIDTNADAIAFDNSTNGFTSTNVQGALEELKTQLAGTSDTLVNNNDGTYTHTTVSGDVVIIDANTTTVSIDKGIYTFKDGKGGVITTIDTNASATGFDDSKSQLGSDNVQGAIDNLVEKIGKGAGVTLVDNNNGTITLKSKDGDVLGTVNKANLTNNNDGTYTFDNGNGTPVVIDTNADAIAFDNSTNGFTSTNVQGALEELKTQLAGTSDTLVNNNDGTYTHTTVSGDVVIIDANTTTVSIDKGIYTFKDGKGGVITTIDTNASATGFDDSKSQLGSDNVQGAIDNLVEKIGKGAGVTLVDNNNGTITLKSKDGDVLGTVNKANLTNNNDGTYTFDNGNGTPVVIDTNADAIAFDNSTNGFTSTNVQGALEELKTQLAGTSDTLVNNNDGTYTHTTVSGDVVIIDANTTTVSIDKGIYTFKDGKGGVITTIDTNASATGFDDSKSQLGSDNVQGAIDNLVEKIGKGAGVTLVDNNNGTITLKSKDGDVLGTVNKANLTNNNDGTYTFDNGNGTPVVIDTNADAIAFDNSTNGFTSTNVQGALEELKTQLSGTSDSLVNNNDGTYTHTTVSGDVVIIDANTTTVSIDKGIYTFKDGKGGVITTIDTNASATGFDDSKSQLGSDNVQGAIDNLVEKIGKGAGVTLVDNNNGTITLKSKDGDVLGTVNKANLTNNNDGTYTFDNGNGTPVVIDTNADAIAFDNSTNGFTSTNVQGALEELKTQLAGTSDTLVNNNDGTYTHTTVSGDVVIIDANTTTVSIDKGIYTFKDGKGGVITTIDTNASATGFDDSKSQLGSDNVQGAIDNLVEKIGKGAGVTLVDNNNGTITLKSKDGDVLGTVNKANLTNNNDGTYTFDNGNGTPVVIDTNADAIAFDNSTNGFTSTNVQGALEELKTQLSGTSDSLVNNNDGTYTHTTVSGDVVIIDANTTTVSIDKGIYTFKDGKGGVITTIDTNASATGFDDSKSQLGSDNVQGAIDNLVEKIGKGAGVTLVDNNNGTITLKSKDGDVLGTVNKANLTNNNDGTYTFDNGNGTPVVIDTNADAIAFDNSTNGFTSTNVQGALEELKTQLSGTSDSLVNNNDGTYTHTTVSGDVVIIDANTTTVSIDKGIYTFKDGKGGVITTIDTNASATGFDDTKSQLGSDNVQGAIDNLVEKIGKGAGVTLVDNNNGTITLKSKDGDVLGTVNKANLTNNNDGTYTFDNGNGTPVVIDTNADAIAFDNSTNGFTSTNVQGALEELKTQLSGTSDSLVNNNDGTYTHTTVSGDVVIIDANTTTVSIDKGIYTFKDGKGGVITTIDTNASATGFDDTKSQLGSDNVQGAIDNLVEKIGKGAGVTLVDNNNGTITLKSKDGDVLGTVNKANLTNNNDGTYTFDNGNGTPVVIDTNADAIAFDNSTNGFTSTNVQGALEELKTQLSGTSDSLVNNNDGTYTHTTVSGDVVIIDANTTTVSIDKGIYTFKDGKGGVITTIDTNASATGFDDSKSQLGSDNVQGAIDNLVEKITIVEGAKGNLSVSGGLEFTGGTNGVAKLLAEAGIQIADKGVTASKLVAEGSDKGKVATVNVDGSVTYQDITANSLVDTKTLSTDGVIVIGKDSNATDTTAVKSLLADVKLNIANNKITTEHIANGTIKPEDIAKAGNNQVLVTDTDGNPSWKNQSKVAPQFFYMPAVIFDTKAKATGLVRDLYKEYVDQFTGGKIGDGNANYNIAHGAGGYKMPYTGGIVGSEGAPSDIAIFNSGELHYYVTYYDTKVFANLKIDKDGKLTYDIIGNATPASYMNIVFVIK
ncbi:hypothetical protein LNQ81_00870 [Myroides sp. M-43]|uniref:hypothetical protein n=1 Tax=Myroides oncorhynchi TaxID=2893756 RepID=UPI001E4F3D06|nr:hypothetical protein [Myroides oncorhynchi]MCC9041287.1 hypothetical protein [Myroides oncorhynchi]